MSYQALYRAWRPTTFSEICDQDAVVKTLRRQVETGHIVHAYLFCGSRGTGKTTAAKVLARAINCLSPVNGDPCGTCEVCQAILRENCMDVLEIDAASNNSVDEIRELRDKIKYPPMMTRHKVYIIDEVHMLSPGAFNALLKTLEEPPNHAVFILATTEPQKLPATILSRCQRFDFHRISVEAIVARLKVVLKGIGREAEESALTEIARAAEGALRDALSILDVCLAFTEGTVSAELTRNVLGTTGRDFMFEFTDALIGWDAAAALRKIDEAMRRGGDPRVFSLDAASHLRAVMLAEIADDDLSRLLEITPEDAERFREQASRANRDQLMRAMELFMRVESEMKWVTQPQTILELAAVRACHPEQEPDAALTERLECIEHKLESSAFVAAAPLAEGTVTAAAEPAKSAPKPAKSGREEAAAVAPGETPPQAYFDAIERLGAENPSLPSMLGKLRFAGVKDGIVTLRYGRDAVIVYRYLESRLEVIEAMLSKTFGMPMRVRLQSEEDTAAAVPSTARSVIDQSLDIFGRDKIVFTD